MDLNRSPWPGRLYFAGESNFTGHAIECRINAENPMPILRRLPAVWKCITRLVAGVRLDSHVYAGYVPPYDYGGQTDYRGQNRREAIARMSPRSANT